MTREVRNHYHSSRSLASWFSLPYIHPDYAETTRTLCHYSIRRITRMIFYPVRFNGAVCHISRSLPHSGRALNHRPIRPFSRWYYVPD